MAPRPRKNGPPELHELEAEVMAEMWRVGERSVRLLMEALNERAAKPRAYTTYMTIMSRLHAKGLLERRREGKTDFYAPALSSEEYAEQRTATEVQALVERYGDKALVSFARQMADLDPQRLRALRRLARES